MDSEIDDLIAWCHQQREDAVRQIDLFTAQGVKAILHMPDATTLDITGAVLDHQIENITAFERLERALRP